MRAALPFTVSCLLFVLACAGCTDSAEVAQLTEIKVTGRGADAGGEFCSDFGLDEVQARDFFKRAVEIDAGKLHQLDTLPCYVRGTGKLHGMPATWLVRAGGTAEVDSEVSHLLMACSSCEDLLGGKAD
jgi:hypothetical protein